MRCASFSQTGKGLVTAPKPGALAASVTSCGVVTVVLSPTVRLNSALVRPARTATVAGTVTNAGSLEASVTTTLEGAVTPSRTSPALVRVPLPSTTADGKVSLIWPHNSSAPSPRAQAAASGQKSGPGNCGRLRSIETQRLRLGLTGGCCLNVPPMALNRSWFRLILGGPYAPALAIASVSWPRIGCGA